MKNFYLDEHTSVIDKQNSKFMGLVKCHCLRVDRLALRTLTSALIAEVSNLSIFKRCFTLLRGMVFAFKMLTGSSGTTVAAFGPVRHRNLAVGSSPIVVSAVVIPSFIRNILETDRSGSLGIGAVSPGRLVAVWGTISWPGSFLTPFGHGVFKSFRYCPNELVYPRPGGRLRSFTTDRIYASSGHFASGWGPFSISRKEFNSKSRARASSAVAGSDFLSSHRSVESLRPSIKLVRTICSTK